MIGIAWSRCLSLPCCWHTYTAYLCIVQTAYLVVYAGLDYTAAIFKRYHVRKEALNENGIGRKPRRYSGYRRCGTMDRERIHSTGGCLRTEWNNVMEWSSAVANPRRTKVVQWQWESTSIRPVYTNQSNSTVDTAQGRATVWLLAIYSCNMPVFNYYTVNPHLPVLWWNRAGGCEGRSWLIHGP